jgi:exportin-7
MKSCLATSNSINSLCEFIIKRSMKETEESQAMKQVLSEVPTLLSTLLQEVITVVLTEDSNYMWTLSKPLLGLIILNERNYEEICIYVISKITSNSDMQQTLSQAMNKLMAGVSRNLDLRNRDRFARNFNELRQSLSSFNS